MLLLAFGWRWYDWCVINYHGIGYWHIQSRYRRQWSVNTLRCLLHGGGRKHRNSEASTQALLVAEIFSRSVIWYRYNFKSNKVCNHLSHLRLHSELISFVFTLSLLLPNTILIGLCPDHSIEQCKAKPYWATTLMYTSDQAMYTSIFLTQLIARLE